MYKFLVNLFGLESLDRNEPPLEMPIEDEDESFLDLAIQICLAQTDEELLIFFKQTSRYDTDLRYLISLRLKELHEKI